MADISRKSMADGHESPLPAMEQMARWRFVWLKAVAMAWVDPEFKQNLIENPRLTLHNVFGFEAPGGLALKVDEVDPNTEEGWGWKGGRWKLPNNEVTMVLPSKPKEELKVDGVALATYSEMGRTHPFTFCL